MCFLEFGRCVGAVGHLSYTTGFPEYLGRPSSFPFVITTWELNSFVTAWLCNFSNAAGSAPGSLLGSISANQYLLSLKQLTSEPGFATTEVNCSPRLREDSGEDNP
jgi:hypothetical protein